MRRSLNNALDVQASIATAVSVDATVAAAAAAYAVLVILVIIASVMMLPVVSVAFAGVVSIRFVDRVRPVVAITRFLFWASATATNTFFLEYQSDTTLLGVF